MTLYLDIIVTGPQRIPQLNGTHHISSNDSILVDNKINPKSASGSVIQGVMPSGLKWKLQCSRLSSTPIHTDFSNCGYN